MDPEFLTFLESLDSHESDEKAILEDKASKTEWSTEDEEHEEDTQSEDRQSEDRQSEDIMRQTGKSEVDDDPALS